MRIFSLKNSKFDIPKATQYILHWADLPHEIYNEVMYRQQFLVFHRYLIENLQSVSEDQPNYAPKPLSLSLRAGAIQSYVVLAVSIIEVGLAGLAEIKAIVDNPQELYSKTYGAILKVWSTDGQPKKEVEPIWQDLQLLKKFRNHIHLDNAASDKDSYWKEVLKQETNLLKACDKTLSYLSDLCDGLQEYRDKGLIS